MAENEIIENYVKCGEMLYDKNFFREAVDFFEQASKLGNAQAKHWLFLCYYDGLGVDRNIEKAYIYLIDAVQLGDPDAINDYEYLKYELC